MLPARCAPALFGLILSGLMSLLVSAISTLRAAGPGADWLPLWIGAWLTAWLLRAPHAPHRAAHGTACMNTIRRAEPGRSGSGPFACGRRISRRWIGVPSQGLGHCAPVRR